MKVDITLTDLIVSYADFLKNKFGKEFNFKGGFVLDINGKEEAWMLAAGEHHLRFDTK